MAIPGPNRPVTLSDLWSIEDADAFAGAAGAYLYTKQWKRKLPLSVAEQNIRDVLNIYAAICINGFDSLFYQEFALADCRRVETAMREMGLHQLADWFSEALLIFCRRRADLSEEEFAALTRSFVEEADAHRLGEIGELFLSDGSELFQIAAPIKDYAIKHREEFK